MRASHKTTDDLTVEASRIVSLFHVTAENLESVARDPYMVNVCRAVQLLSACFSAGGKLLVFGKGRIVR
jgi:phosphoheptose isomerase